MPPPLSQPSRESKRATTSWKLEDAQARFSEVVRRMMRAHRLLPYAAAAPLSSLMRKNYERLAKPAPEMPLVLFLEGLDLDGLDLTRDAVSQHPNACRV